MLHVRLLLLTLALLLSSLILSAQNYKTDRIRKAVQVLDLHVEGDSLMPEETVLLKIKDGRKICLRTNSMGEVEHIGIPLFNDVMRILQPSPVYDFLEYANYVGNYYGTPKSYVVEQLKQGKDVLLEIEIQGAMQVKKLMPEALTIFVMPPSANTLKDRLVGRGTEKKEVIEARLGRAVEESQGIENYDYILVNDDLEESTKRLNELISLAHDASFRNYNFINKIREELKVFRKEI